MFTEGFGNIELDYNSISKEEKDIYIQKIKKIKKIIDEEILKLDNKNLINIKYFYIGAFTHLRNQRESNIQISNTLNDLMINNKIIFIIMTDNMEHNIKKMITSNILWMFFSF